MAILKPTTTLAAEYAVMDRQKKDLEKQLNDLKERMKTTEHELLDRFGAEGVQSIKSEFGLVYLRRQLWASCKDPSLLHQTELSWLVKDSVNGQQLSAAIREMPGADVGLPEIKDPLINEAITVSEVYSVRVRKN